MKRSKLLLDPLQKRLLHLSTAILWVSGTLWLCLSEGSASRPLWMKIHGAAAMAFLMVFGTLLLHHVPAGWQQDRGRRSGGLLVTICGILILTGWLLYYAGSEELRRWASLIHWILGLAIPALIYIHVRVTGESDVT